MWEPPAAGARADGAPHPTVVLVCENRQSLLALPDLEGVVALHGGGYAVEVLGQTPWAAAPPLVYSWAAAPPLVYWGDLDRDGFAILDRLRRRHDSVTSVLVDAAALERHRALCVPDSHPEPVTLTRLMPAEVRAALVAGSAVAGPGTGDAGDAVGPLRLEQERIAWDRAEPRIRRSVEAARMGERG